MKALIIPYASRLIYPSYMVFAFDNFVQECIHIYLFLIIANYAHAFFFAAADLAFAAFFRLLRIITMPRKDPTTADPNSVRITGIRIAHTRGGKRS